MFALALIDPFSGKGGDLQPIATVQTLEDLKMPIEGATRIFPFAWLIDLNKNLSLLRKLLNLADDSKLQYRIFFLEKEPTIAA